MKRKAAQSKQNPREHTTESSSASQNAGQAIIYEEASGKTVAFVRYAPHLKGWAAFEIRFTDGTFLFIDPIPQVEFRVRFLEAGRGNVKAVRDYGITGQ